MVSKVADSYVGLLVLGFMNAVVRADRVRVDLRWLPLERCWASGARPEHTIAVGDTVAFTVAALEQDGPYVTLAGDLKGRDTGNVAHVKERTKGGKQKCAEEAEALAEAANGSAARAAAAAPPSKAAAREPPPGEAAAGKKRKKVKGGGGEGGGPPAAAAAAVPPKEEEERRKKKRKKQGH